MIVEAVGSTKPVLGARRGDFINKAVNEAVAALYALHESKWREWAKTREGTEPKLTDADILACKQKSREDAKAKFSKLEDDEIQRRARALEAAVSAPVKK
jgi:hypothetical protein